MTTLTAASKWIELGDDHEFRLVKAKGEIIGGVLKHKIKGQDVWCEPGLVQWEPFGEPRPLFERTEQHGNQLSLLPFIVCEICGDKGWISNGTWVAKEDEIGVEETKQRLRVLEEQDVDEDEEDAYFFAIRRDLGDKVPQEEKNADRKLYDLQGGPSVIPDVDPELERLLAEEEEAERLLDDEEKSSAEDVLLFPHVPAEVAGLMRDEVLKASGRSVLMTREMADRMSDGFVFHDEQVEIEGVDRREGNGGDRKQSRRKDLLDETASLILGDRNNSYGPPHQDFARTAEMVTAMWRDKLKPGESISAHEVAEFVICIKLSRLQWTPNKRDNWTDIAGYAACGYEAFFETNPEAEEK